MKRILAFLLIPVLFLSGCTPKREAYQALFTDVFDTVTTLRGYERSQADFDARAEQVHRMLGEYHRLFNIYEDYPGGLKRVNDNAGICPVAVEPPVLELLKSCRDACALTGGRVNAAMGSVLSLWHDAREAGLADPERAALPDAAALKAAAEHVRFDTVVLDEAAGTVYLADPEQRLDVGAIAKGWAAQRVAEQLPEGYLLSVGGNVCARGTKPDGSGWGVAVQSPEPGTENLCVVTLSNQALVTSGDYQRFYTVDGKRFHHIIDPDTQQPAAFWRSVSVLAEDSALADCLSTALFLLPLEKGRALAEQCGVEVMWVDADLSVTQTPGFAARAQQK